MVGGGGFGGSYASRAFAQGRGFDPRALPSASNLLAWWCADLGTVAHAQLTSNITAPTVTWSGTGQVLGLVVECNDVTGGSNLGQSKFRYSLQGGAAGSWVSGVPTAASVALFGADITLAFGVGTYTASQSWEPVCSTFIDQVGGHVLTNGTQASLPHMRRNSLLGNRAGLIFDGSNDLLLCSDSLANAVVGHFDKPFTAFCVARAPTLSAASVCWSLQNSAPGGQSFVDFYTTLTLHACNKRGESDSTHSRSGGLPDTNAHVYRLVQSGTTVQCSRDKVSQFSGAQDATSMTVDNLSVGGTFIGGSPSNRNPLELASLLFYDTASLTPSLIDQIETGLLGYYQL